ncbi:methyl-accepting chemotaxis protein [Schauerella aestuarii]|uniref:methyl-accepting chemotaxis protein n=1 Tax=Schauerella aestuarii TaxID=2511204 RepID=UPI00136A8F49|nr:methyl-accepting chemotaxis protein [Achromobacter aestuarii]MYZ42331.1 HAMP domain-containing protein [Achromobacter aestuarii]
MKNLKIGTRLAAAFTALIVFLACVAGVGVYEMRAQEVRTNRITQSLVPKLDAAQDIAYRAVDIAHVVRNIILLTDDAGMQANKMSLDAHRVQANMLMDRLEKLVDTDESRAAFAEVRAALTAYRLFTDQVVAPAMLNDNETATRILYGAGYKTQAALIASLEKMVNLLNRQIQAAAVASEADTQFGMTMMIAVAVLAALAAIFGSVLITRSVTKPLALAVSSADRVANGDLSVPVPDGARDETGRLLNALQRMQHSLFQTVGTVRENAHSVALASAEIAQGNSDLSSRTEEQAAALEETAASMEQLGTTVQQNADHAQQANQLAMHASTSAATCGGVVAEVVETMKGINDSSKRIVDIIAVIDSIAFQTNILALNAAVEAARAGEQGRGFAVVASEVRNLAQRSAEAAKEIKGLITTSVANVQLGTAQVDRAGASMSDVVAAIQRVADIMGEITAATVEQSQGVSQVVHAVNQMDQTTQQNAALVEQSAAAAAGLKDQAQTLVDTMAVFKLAAQEISAARPERTAPTPALGGPAYA